MSDTPTVSIITATHNALDGLKRTVHSVAGQMDSVFEHVIVDGGSIDGTRGWLEQLDLPVRWISEPDDGIADAMNKGLELSTGQWVLYLHADDTFLDETSLQRAIRSLVKGADVVSHDVLFVEDSKTRIYRSRGFSWFLNFKTTIPHQGAFCARTLFDRIGGFDTSLQVAMDYDFFLRAHREAAVVVVDPEIVTMMPATGRSSRRDWKSLEARFCEERIVQERHSLGPSHRLMYSVYWPLYRGYRRIRSLSADH